MFHVPFEKGLVFEFFSEKMVESKFFLKKNWCFMFFFYYFCSFGKNGDVQVLFKKELVFQVF